jgi:hypothetical protein
MLRVGGVSPSVFVLLGVRDDPLRIEERELEAGGLN